MNKPHRIYVNSYTQRSSGNDVDCVIDLGTNYLVSSIQLDTVAMDNLFMNFYQSQGKDFRRLSFNGSLGGVNFQTSISIDQYIKSPTSFCDYLSADPYFVA